MAVAGKDRNSSEKHIDVVGHIHSSVVLFLDTAFFTSQRLIYAFRIKTPCNPRGCRVDNFCLYSRSIRHLRQILISNLGNRVQGDQLSIDPADLDRPMLRP